MISAAEANFKSKHQHEINNILGVIDKGYYIHRGDKLTTPENTGESCNRLAEELKLFGYECRVGYNQEANNWSVAIL